MKTMISFLFSMLTLSAVAQNITLTFQGAANRARTYQVVIDGVSYYSSNSVNTRGRQVSTISNIPEGSHNLEVYALSNKTSSMIDGTTARPSTRPIYTKTFQTRLGYDMDIMIRANGRVSFTEKQSQQSSAGVTGAPMSSTAFNQLVQNINNRRYQSERISLVRSAFTTSANYFTTTQVRQLLTMVPSESQRLELARLSYNRVTDKTNFSTVYDVLQSEASRDALDNYVVDQGGSVESNQSYPAYGTAMSESNFTQLLNRTRGYSYQSDRISVIRTALENSSNYFSTSQVRQLLSLINSEGERLTLAQLAYTRVVDQSSFNQLVDLFYTQANRTAFNNFITSNGGVVSNTGTTGMTAMSDAAFQQIYNKARNHFFSRNTIADLQAAFANTSNHFSTEQVRILLQLVNAESSRLPLAKSAFARVVDPLNYSRVVDLFTTESNRTDLDNYIRSRQ